MDYNYGQSNDYPLRILVPSDSVGAIIGKQGATIKQIKQTTHAKVDVDKVESSNSPERVVSIRGLQENCIHACREILRIMYEDAQNKNKSNEIVLKVLAHNNFIGRIIGKSGNIINTIKQETDTNITVSSINDLNSYNIERIISIKGELEQQIHAAENIYAKLCAAYENDNLRVWNYSQAVYQYPQQQFMQSFTQPQGMMSAGAATAGSAPLLSGHYPSQHPTTIMSQTSTTSSNSPTNKYFEQQQQPSALYQPPYYQPMYPISGSYFMPYPSANHLVSSYAHQYGNATMNGNPQYSQSIMQLSPQAQTTIETVHLYVPNAVVGAIIGAKGVFIKSIIKNSNASVKVTPISPDEDQTKIIDRQVTITGTPEAQWKSQYYIYDKIRQEGYAGDDEVRLRAEILVPTSLIGRLVGKGGHNVRQLQQSTGAIIKLPEDSQQTSASEVPVKIIGPFQASQFAQRRIQSIIQMSRDLSNVSNDDSNNNNNNNNSNPSSSEQLNGLAKLNLNETSTLVNGNTINDDAVVATSTLPATDDSLTTVDEQKSRDE